VTIHDNLKTARARLVAAGIDPSEAARDVALLARHVLGLDAASLLVHEIDRAPDGFDAAFASLVDRRARREPMAYIRGVQEFWGREFVVTPDVLIPRPETELIVEEALGKFTVQSSKLKVVADVGTGSGCLAITLAAELPDTRIVATDVSADALAVAKQNAARHGVSDRIEFREGTCLAGADGPFDLIVSNPPYVAERDRPALPPEVREFEPARALMAGPDGLDVIREILAAAPRALGRGGLLLMEIGHGQAGPVRALVAGLPALTLVDIRPDLQGIPRVVVVGHQGL
jgi:release factor glutamine methyltransferase